MDLEEAFQLVGEFGGHQKRMIAVLIMLQVMIRLASFVDINHWDNDVKSNRLKYNPNMHFKWMIINLLCDMEINIP